MTIPAGGQSVLTRGLAYQRSSQDFSHTTETKVNCQKMLQIALIFALFPPILSEQCPPGSVVGLKPGDCYTYKPAAAWFDAEEECVTSGGHLASVHDVFTNSFVAKLPKYLSTISDGFWMGGSFGITTSDRWSWSDKTSFEFIHSARGNSFSMCYFCVYSFYVFYVCFSRSHKRANILTKVFDMSSEFY